MYLYIYIYGYTLLYDVYAASFGEIHKWGKYNNLKGSQEHQMGLYVQALANKHWNASERKLDQLGGFWRMGWLEVTFQTLEPIRSC